VAVLHNDGLALEFDAWIEIVDSGAAIESPAVPGTNDLIAVEISVAQGAAGVRTATIETAEGASMVAKSVGGIVDLELGEGAWREVSQGFYFGEGHGKS